MRLQCQLVDPQPLNRHPEIGRVFISAHFSRDLNNILIITFQIMTHPLLMAVVA